jgi:hypothetical protein
VDVAPRGVKRADLKHHQVERAQPLRDLRVLGRETRVSAEEHAMTRTAQRLGPFDLVMLEVGAFHPAWGDIHLGPDNALQALSLLGGGVFLPVHWGTFNLALHDWDQPAERLIELAPSRGVQLLMPKLGVAVEPHQVESVDPWWREISSREVSRPSSPTAVPLQAPID